MTWEAIITLITISTALLGSPGPAPIALAATGAVFGFREGLPFLAGVLLGLGVALCLTFTGLASLLESNPEMRLMLQIAGALYIGFIAYKIASAPLANSSISRAPRAPSFRDGFILNLINPKVYAAFLAIFSQFLLPADSAVTASLATGLVVFLVAVTVDVLWLALGGLLAPLFLESKSARAVRITFALIMVCTVLWAMFHDS